jgi:hypothetical protein
MGRVPPHQSAEAAFGNVFQPLEDPIEDDWMADVLRGRDSLNGTLAEECGKLRPPEDAPARLPNGSASK